MSDSLPLQKTEIEKLTVEVCEDSTRIYDYLVGKLVTISSRKGVKKALSRDQIYLNNQLAKSGDYVHQGDLIILFENKIVDHKYFEIELNVIYEDEELAIVEKPAGIPVSGNTFKTLQNALPDHVSKSSAKDYLPIPLPAHRIDAPTHGIVVVAKTHSTRVELGRMFENREMKKSYQAIVQGRLEGRGTLNSSIDGKSAVTYFESMAVFPSVKNEWISLIKLSPVTGRKHQLRIHLSRLGFPIVGDKQYGKKGFTLKYKGMFLAAVGISFKHPKTNEELSFEIELPNKFNRFLKREENWVKRIEDKKN
ncbi:RluA family pseudouridine synthase [Brumimicrobium glaciale]|uniref:RluA family pseudouridine synthase n=1 Tax=Brumimicrobium glaciale TaxID=200475 RepID=A0A4Q4KLC7_9FLAO|nr:RluA family pseudouridine synthase [Brumimicrobium glaciale]RYM33537.1 RluA family pseudouridine synthase [Brumimicrobium glaciale]